MRPAFLMGLWLRRQANRTSALRTKRILDFHVDTDNKNRLTPNKLVRPAHSVWSQLKRIQEIGGRGLDAPPRNLARESDKLV